MEALLQAGFSRLDAAMPEKRRPIIPFFARGLANRSDDGSAYFKVAEFPGHGRPPHTDLSGLRGGTRVAQDENGKERGGDFAPWKAWDETDEKD